MPGSKHKDPRLSKPQAEANPLNIAEGKWWVMFGHSWRLGRIAGVEVRIDASWVVIALLITYSLFLQFTATYRTLDSPAGITLAVGATVLFFSSVLAHELSHALVARRVGIPVKSITLFIFGGVTEAHVDSQGPKGEFMVSSVGPLSSIALAGVFWGLSVALRGIAPDPVVGAIGYLGWVNLMLAAFNLLPGFPLDGGRILRSIMWGTTHSLRRATRAASLVGEAMGYLMIAAAFFFVFGGLLISGIWLAAIGWFLAQAARSSWQQQEMRGLPHDVAVEQVIQEQPVSLPAHLPLDEVAERYLLRLNQSVFPVEERGRTVGIVTLASVRAVPRTQWPEVLVEHIMRPLDKDVSVTTQAPLETVLNQLEVAGEGFLLVMEDGHVMGIVTAADVGAGSTAATL
jgi:Zn-dependent protease